MARDPKHIRIIVAVSRRLKEALVLTRAGERDTSKVYIRSLRRWLNNTHTEAPMGIATVRKAVRELENRGLVEVGTDSFDDGWARYVDAQEREEREQRRKQSEQERQEREQAKKALVTMLQYYGLEPETGWDNSVRITTKKDQKSLHRLLLRVRL